MPAFRALGVPRDPPREALLIRGSPRTSLPTSAIRTSSVFHAPAGNKNPRLIRVHFRGDSNENGATPPSPPPSYNPPSLDSIDDETAELLGRYEVLFASADTDGDGYLNRSELRRVMERVSGGAETAPLHWLTAEDVDRLFDNYDKNEDGHISLKEFKSLAHDNVFLTKELKEYKAAFEAVDAGGDGFIGPTELCAVLTALGSPLKSYDNITRLMGRYGAGAAGRLDFAGFLRLCRFEKALPLDDILAYAASKRPGNSSKWHKRASVDASADDFDGMRAAAVAPAGEQGAVIAVSSEQVLEEILRLNHDRIIVVMATLSWCRPCKRIAPAYQRLAANYSSAAVFLRLNGNDSDETKRLFKKKLRVRVTPSFLFFKGGRALGHVTGANASKLESTLRSLLPSEELPEKNVYELIEPELIPEDAPAAAQTASA